MPKENNSVRFSVFRTPPKSTARRNIVIASRLALILSGLSFVLVIVLVTLFGASVTTPLILGTGVFFLSLVYLNRSGLENLSRMLLSAVPAMIALVSSVLAKLYSPGYTDILYYDSRFFLVMITIIPCLVFSIGETVKLSISLLLIFACLMIYDPLHEWYGVGYFQRGFASTSYYYINYVAAICFVGIAAGSITLKHVIEKADRKNDRARKRLKKKNKKMAHMLKEQATQNEEITAQSEELITHQEQLLAANQVIERQKQQLLSFNNDLKKKVAEVNAELQETNNELVRHNNELRQFSYTISHNLRGPVARLLGLTQVIREDEILNSEIPQLASYIRMSAQELDDVIRDLNKIVDIRNGIYRVKHRVDFENEWREVKNLLKISNATSGKFHTDFSAAPHVYSVKAMINSMLFNLVSNAIKYQSPQRPLEVTIRTREEESFTILEVQDNGLGINMELFQHDIFKMYKRFHPHQEGKGLGLYLIKSQAEALNGRVEIDSSINRGTTFRVYLKKPIDVHEQICFDSMSAIIHYDAILNHIGIQWRAPAARDEFRMIYLKALEFLRQYNTPSLISDIRHRGVVKEEDNRWMLENIGRDAARVGLRLAAGICLPEEINDESRKKTIAFLEQYGIRTKFFTDEDTARDWIRDALDVNNQ